MKTVKRATVVAFVCIFSVNMKTIMKAFILFNLRIFTDYLWIMLISQVT
jgi:hypothetical protein